MESRPGGGAGAVVGVLAGRQAQHGEAGQAPGVIAVEVAEGGQADALAEQGGAGLDHALGVAVVGQGDGGGEADLAVGDGGRAVPPSELLEGELKSTEARRGGWERRKGPVPEAAGVSAIVESKGDEPLGPPVRLDARTWLAGCFVPPAVLPQGVRFPTPLLQFRDESEGRALPGVRCQPDRPPSSFADPLGACLEPRTLAVHSATAFGP